MHLDHYWASGMEETGPPETMTPARIDIQLTHDCGRSRTHDACTAVLKTFGTLEYISTLPENTRPPSTSLYTEQSGLVCTLYELTHCEAPFRPCVTTPVTVCTEPSEIVMYWPTVFVDADHPCTESSIDCACPVPTASLA